MERWWPLQRNILVSVSSAIFATKEVWAKGAMCSDGHRGPPLSSAEHGRVMEYVDNMPNALSSIQAPNQNSA